MQSDGSIRWPGNELQTGLSYDANEGIIIKSERTPRPRDEESDESYD